MLQTIQEGIWPILPLDRAKWFEKSRWNCVTGLDPSSFRQWYYSQYTLVDLFPQVQAMKQGLMTVVPEQALSLLTWGNLEHGVCGDRDISLAHLKGACKWRASLFCPETSMDYNWLLHWSWLQCKLRYLANVSEMHTESVSFKRQRFHLYQILVR